MGGSLLEDRLVLTVTPAPVSTGRMPLKATTARASQGNPDANPDAHENNGDAPIEIA